MFHFYRIFPFPPPLILRYKFFYVLIMDGIKLKKLEFTGLCPSDGSYIPAGLPQKIASLPENAKLLCTVQLAPASECLVAAVGTALYAVDPDGSSRLIHDTGTEIFCAVATSDTLAVMTAGGALCFSLGPDSEGKIITFTPTGAKTFGGLMLEAAAHQVVVGRVESRTLSKSYLTESVLDAKDAALLVSDLEAAYNEAVRGAAETRSFVGPLIARIKFFDNEGRKVSESSPVLLTHPTEAQFTGIWNVDSSDAQTVSAYNLQLRTWRLRLRRLKPSDSSEFSLSSLSSVSRAEVWVSPQILPYTPAAEGSAVLSLRHDSHFARVSLPGISAGLSTNDSSLAASLLGACINRLDNMDRLVAVIANPFGDGLSSDTPLTLDAGGMGDAAREATALQKGLASNAAAFNNEGFEYVARCGLRVASTLFWGNLCKVRRKSLSPSQFGAAFDNKAWRGYVRISFADGSVSVTEESGSTNVTSHPKLFGPMLYVPAPDAREVEICIYCDDKCYKGVFSLISTGLGSIYAATGTLPFVLEEYAADYILPKTVFAQSSLPEAVAVADDASPADIRLLSNAQGAVSRILTPSRSDSAWDFGCHKAVALTSAGIYGLRRSAVGDQLAVSKISELTVDSGAMTSVVSPRGIYIISGGRLWLLAGSRLSLVQNLPFDDFRCHKLLAMVYNQPLNALELWTAQRQAVCLLSPDGLKITSYWLRAPRQIPGDSPSVCDSSGIRYWLDSSGSIFCSGRSDYPDSQDIKISLWYDLDRASLFTSHKSAPRRQSSGPLSAPIHIDFLRARFWTFSFPAAASSCQGTLKIYRIPAGLTSLSAPEVALRLSGALRCLPLRCYLSPGSDGFLIVFQATVSSDFRFRAEPSLW